MTVFFQNTVNIRICREYRLGLNILFLTLDSGSQKSVVQKNHLDFAQCR